MRITHGDAHSLDVHGQVCRSFCLFEVSAQLLCICGNNDLVGTAFFAGVTGQFDAIDGDEPNVVRTGARSITRQ